MCHEYGHFWGKGGASHDLGGLCPPRRPSVELVCSQWPHTMWCVRIGVSAQRWCGCARRQRRLCVAQRSPPRRSTYCDDCVCPILEPCSYSLSDSTLRRAVSSLRTHSHTPAWTAKLRSPTGIRHRVSITSNPPYRTLSFFSFRFHYMDFPDCLLLLLSTSVYLLFSFFLFLHFFSCRFRAVD